MVGFVFKGFTPCSQLYSLKPVYLRKLCLFSVYHVNSLFNQFYAARQSCLPKRRSVTSSLSVVYPFATWAEFLLTGDLAGGGIIGCSSAYFLTRHPKYDSSKHTITLLEASSIASGASGKAGGLLALWGSFSHYLESSLVVSENNATIFRLLYMAVSLMSFQTHAPDI